MAYHIKCEMCTANKWGLWGRKRGVSSWPKRVRAVFEKLKRGQGLQILQVRQAADASVAHSFKKEK